MCVWQVYLKQSTPAPAVSSISASASQSVGTIVKPEKQEAKKAKLAPPTKMAQQTPQQQQRSRQGERFRALKAKEAAKKAARLGAQVCMKSLFEQAAWPRLYQGLAWSCMFSKSECKSLASVAVGMLDLSLAARAGDLVGHIARSYGRACVVS